MKPTLLVLAAGMGSRYGGLKQVDPVGPNGEILLEYSAFDALRAGFGRLVFVIRKDIEEPFREKISSRVEGQIPVDYAFQDRSELPEGFSFPEGRTKPWGRAQAILSARSVVKEPFVAINADDFYGPSSFATVAAHLGQASGDSYSMVGFQLKNTLSEHGSVSRGVCEVDADSKLISVTEHTKIESTPDGPVSTLPDGSTHRFTGDELVSMNFWGLYPSIFSQLENQFRDFLQARSQDLKSEMYIPAVLDQIIRTKQGSVRVLTSQESWFGVTYPEDKALVVGQIAQKVAAGVYPERLWS